MVSVTSLSAHTLVAASPTLFLEEPSILSDVIISAEVTWTRAEVAQKLGVHRATVYKWHKDPACPKVGSLQPATGKGRHYVPPGFTYTEDEVERLRLYQTELTARMGHRVPKAPVSDQLTEITRMLHLFADGVAAELNSLRSDIASLREELGRG